MANLKNSIAVLFAYIIIVLGVAQVDYIEQNILNFDPVFFVLFALAMFAGIFLPSLINISIYLYLLICTFVYALTWLFYWRVDVHPLGLQVLGIQFILVAISAGLAFDVGHHLKVLMDLFEGLAATTYPNRTFEIQQAGDRISAELTRSRRYHHPLSLLIVELEKDTKKREWKQLEGLQQDLLRRFAVARVGQIISERARETDLILRDPSGRFMLLCPETSGESSAIFGERIRRVVAEAVGTDVIWSYASFPDEALTFDELVERAEQRLAWSVPARELESLSEVAQE